MLVFTEEETRDFIASLDRRSLGANLMIENQEGSLLVIKNNYEHVWGLPGGWLEAGESPLQAALRETEEEIGLVVDEAAVKLRYILDVDHHFGRIIATVFKLADPLSADTVLNLQADEILAAEWVSREAVLNRQDGRDYTGTIRLWATGTEDIYHELRA